jgi:hypothetical protein
MPTSLHAIAFDLKLQLSEWTQGRSLPWWFSNLRMFDPDVRVAQLEEMVDGFRCEGLQHDSETPHLVMFASIPLDAGLFVANAADAAFHPKALAARPGLRAGGVVVSADEPSRLGPAWEELYAALSQLDPKRVGFYVHDAGIAAELFDAEGKDLRALAASLATLERLRAAMPMATATAGHRDAWERFAADRGYNLLHAPLFLNGMTEEGIAVVAGARRSTSGSFELVVDCRYRVRLEEWVAVDDLSEQVGTWPWSRKDPIEVRGPAAESARALPDEARDRLRELARTGEVRMRDEGLSVTIPLPEAPERSIGVIADVTEIVSRSWRVATGTQGPVGGAYRTRGGA